MDNNLMPLAIESLGIDSLWLGEVLARFVGMYLLHSTLLLAGVWLLLRSARFKSQFIRERLWKFAAVAGIVSAGIQLGTGFGIPVTWQLQTRQPQIASDIDARQLASSLELESTLALVETSLDELNDELEGTFAAADNAETIDSGEQAPSEPIVPSIVVDANEARLEAAEEQPIDAIVLAVNVSDESLSSHWAWQHYVIAAVLGWLLFWCSVLV